CLASTTRALHPTMFRFVSTAPTFSLSSASSCHPVPPALPSFPTRRSSDLCCSSATTSPSPTSATTAPSSRPTSSPSSSSFCTARSEEHTSELQSHLNLVCRLLLEKKKPQ